MAEFSHHSIEQATPTAPMSAVSSIIAREPQVPWSLRWLFVILRRWIKIKLDPPDPRVVLRANEVPVIYMLERYGVSNALILEAACASLGMPSPLHPAPGELIGKRRALLAISRREGFLFRRPRSATHSEGLRQLIERVANDASMDVQVIPVSIFVGRAPNRDSGWFSVLFSENWVMVGRFRRLLSLFLNGRDTIVHFSPAVSLREVTAEGMTPDRTLRKAIRVLRTHFRRVRESIIGPDLSHRRTMIDSVLAAENVRVAISAQAGKDKSSIEDASTKARALAWEIAADYSHPVVRSWSFLLTAFWNKIFDGVTMHHFENAKAAARGYEVIYVPCHRSHMDYLLLSYLLYTNGIVPPHIAAGVNLNLPVVGSILRMGGAFFLRRSFKSNALYSAVFTEYVQQLHSRGIAIEYFIEGGRSRTGRLVDPRAGMLSMTVKSFLNDSRRPILFQPVYIGYEKLIEEKSYSSELSGQAKEKESIFGLLKSLSILKNRYGKVAVSFGDPVILGDHLDEVAPDWRAQSKEKDARPEWLARSISTLAEKIHVKINQAAHVNPINLIAMAILSAPKHAMSEDDLLRQLHFFKAVLERMPYSDRVTVTPLTPNQIIDYGIKLNVLVRIKHPLGDVLEAPGESATLLSYYRNNVLHLFVVSAWVGCCFLNNRRLARSSIVRLGRVTYPFIKKELYLRHSEDEFAERVGQVVDLLVEYDLLRKEGDGRVIRRRAGQTDAAFQLRNTAHSLLQAFQRYYIALSLLTKNGSGKLSVGELENLCHLTAQRLSLLHAAVSPEFFDKALFKQFIQTLRERKIVWLDENAKLAFANELELMSKDARLILRREVRHSILNVAGLTLDAKAAILSGASTTLPSTAAPNKETHLAAPLVPKVPEENKTSTTDETMSKILSVSDPGNSNSPSASKDDTSANEAAIRSVDVPVVQTAEPAKLQM